MGILKRLENCALWAGIIIGIFIILLVVNQIFDPKIVKDSIIITAGIITIILTCVLIFNLKEES